MGGGSILAVHVHVAPGGLAVLLQCMWLLPLVRTDACPGPAQGPGRRRWASCPGGFGTAHPQAPQAQGERGAAPGPFHASSLGRPGWAAGVQLS